MRGSSELRSLSSPVVRVNVAAWGVDHLLAKPDRAGSLPWETVIGTGHRRCGVVRGCPLRTGHDPCEWHAGGTAGGNERGSSLALMAQAGAMGEARPRLREPRWQVPEGLAAVMADRLTIDPRSAARPRVAAAAF